MTRAAPAQIRKAVLCLMNQSRRRDHLPPLWMSRRLTHSAQSWTDVMVRRDLFAHATGSSSPAARVRAAGYDGRAIAEDIATGFRTPAAVFDAWMASSEHCFNILSPQFRDVGIGFDDKAVGRARQGATWTSDFGNSFDRRSPSGNWGPAYSCRRHRG